MPGRRQTVSVSESPPKSVTSLKQQLERKLHNPGRVRRADDAEGAAVYISIRLPKLRVVEGVEGLGPKLQVHSLLDSRVFQQCCIPVIEAGSGEESPVRVPNLAQVFRSKERLIEVGLAFAGIGDAQRTVGEVRPVDGNRNGSGARGSQQGTIVYF